MEILYLITGAVLLGVGFIAGGLVYGDDGCDDEYECAYKKEYSGRSGLYEPRRR